jgi:hypothetical protein
MVAESGYSRKRQLGEAAARKRRARGKRRTGKVLPPCLSFDETMRLCYSTIMIREKPTSITDCRPRTRNGIFIMYLL